jgi:hypothetical protein
MGGRAGGERSAGRGAREEKEARAERMARRVRSAKIASRGPGMLSAIHWRGRKLSPLDGLFTSFYFFT